MQKLARSGHTSWSLVETAFDDGPWIALNPDAAKTLAAASASGLGVTVTASGHAPFDPSDVGRALRLTHGANEPGWGVIAAYISATEVTVDIRRAFTSTAATADWQLGAWSAATGYPQAVAFFEQRACYAKTTNQPQTFWMSQSADLENMRPDSRDSGANTVQDDDALDFTMAAERVDVIQWLSPGAKLVVGTGGRRHKGEEVLGPERHQLHHTISLVLSAGATASSANGPGASFRITKRASSW